ncbi:MAG TPA: hypothetical protein VFB38_06335 [Chthonomonadaceae bacterium]|nr:hypothetical protein [Chthonomonadaceae bacterium]
MTETVRRSRPQFHVRARRGQTLIVAIAVIFILLFIGGVFVAQVARNLVAAGRSRDVQDAQSLAEAGIQYCNTELTNSTEGADWRPAPTPPMVTTADAFGTTDPDYFWLSKGFSRVLFPGGRALVRVTYDPHPADPRSQLLKIESIGRSGDLGNGLDPTVFVQTNSEAAIRGLRRELIAYKQIGLTDYLRYITDKDRRHQEAVIGVPDVGHRVAMMLGNPLLAYTNGNTGTNNGEWLPGAAIRSNPDLRLVGNVFFYTNPQLPSNGIYASGKFRVTPTIDMNGDGKVDSQDAQAFVNQNPQQPANPNNVIYDSDDPNHTTNGGLVRDMSNQPDKFGYPNNIPYLDPPRIDTYTEGSGVLRYRALTRDSGVWLKDNNGKLYNTGQNGWGRGIYINNPQDLQRETTRRGVSGSYSLRADWLNPNAQFAQSYWQGPFYRPPGVQIELLGDRIRLTRSDDNVFTKPDGTPITAQGGKVIEIPLADDERANYTFPDGTSIQLLPLDKDGDEPPAAGQTDNRPFGDRNSYGVNLVLMAEGNVRVKGVYGAVTDSRDTTKPHLGRVHLTIVSGGTAYIEGNILKGDGYLDASGVQHLERASTCAILAKDYVTVNTTMFLTPENQTNVFSRTTPDLDAFSVEIGLSRPTFDASFAFGVNPNLYTTNGQTSPVFLLLRHAALNPGPSYINLLLNPALTTLPGGQQANPFYPFNMNGPSLNGQQVPPPQTYMLGLRFLQPPNNSIPIPVFDSASVTPNFEMRAFPLDIANTVNRIVTDPGYPNLLRFQTDQTAPALIQSFGITAPGASDYLLGGAMVAPLDIRIEALLYAQDNSFFVIPGYSFNPDPKDSRQAFLANGRRPSYSIDPNGNVLDSQADKQAKDAFPFYGEPMDVRITIYGAVAENNTASQGDQAAWMAKWGYIPAAFGSTGLQSLNPQALPASQVIPVPDDHLRVHDPDGYTPGDDRTVDFRTPQEQNTDNKDIPITRGLRFEYDPALAMPYQHPTDASFLSGDLSGDSLNAAYTTSDYLRDPTYLRSLRALRVKVWPAQLNNNGQIILNEVRQVLPPVPRLPVCPGLLYFGDSERNIGT